jgi:hypothetical protein
MVTPAGANQSDDEVFILGPRWRPSSHNEGSQLRWASVSPGVP